MQSWRALYQVLEGLDFMASEEVVHEENLTSPATPATRVPRDLLTVETGLRSS